ncbi:MAG: flap endonuclease-1 [Thaumarchaeota archaeon]|nr:flap endonuclease-1 [Candidatus Calditenuaceae archaeon]MDW8042506.1 flap endonuclease-1 [Nitrososphaerota archaeon]
MGVKLGDIIPPGAAEEVELGFFRGRSVAIDGYNALYQFLSIIRGPDGRPLMDSKGRVTSHLSGLFFRTVNLLEVDMKLVYVFDGEPPQQKLETIRRRIEAKKEALAKYEEALKVGDLEAARRYAVQTATLERYMLESATRLLDAMGVPYVLAPSEGEAQAAHMARKGLVWASASQDYDSILFGSPRLVRNLSVIGRRKLPGRREYVEVKPEVIYTERLFNSLGIGREQLIDVAMLVGTDYIEGVKGIGPKRALQLIREHGSAEAALIHLRVEPKANLRVVRKLFTEPAVTDDVKLEWRPVDPERVKRVLCDEHDFSEERVDKALKGLLEQQRKRSGLTSLDQWY